MRISNLIITALVALLSLSGCIETTETQTTPTQSSSLVNVSAVEGSYRFYSFCTGACLRSGFTINKSGQLTGTLYSDIIGLNGKNNSTRYNISLSSFRSSTSTGTALGAGGGKRKFTYYTANFSGTKNFNGSSKAIRGTTVYEPDTGKMVFTPSNDPFSFEGHQISPDGTTHWQRVNEAARLKNAQNAREIRLSRIAAAAVGAALNVNKPSTTASGVNQRTFISARKCVSLSNSGPYDSYFVQNTCSQEITFLYCRQVIGIEGATGDSLGACPRQDILALYRTNPVGVTKLGIRTTVLQPGEKEITLENRKTGMRWAAVFVNR